MLGFRRESGAGAVTGVAMRYTPPRDSWDASLSELLGGGRSLTEGQQGRLGFDAVSQPSGPTVHCAGDRSLIATPCVAVVGTRNVSQAGAARARRIARELAALGVTVVSGLAKGVDTEAMRAAVDAGGRVIGVLGTPLDRASPVANSSLQEQVYREHLLMSQFAWGAPVHRSNFPQRNKLMAAIAHATVIIEAGEGSGTIHQAAECERLRRWLFITQSLADRADLEWPSKFLTSERSRVLTCVDDITSAFGGIEQWRSKSSPTAAM